MPSRERKRATLLRRIGMATTLLVTSSLLFGTVPVLAATGPGAANSGSIVTAAAKTLSPAPTPKITGTLKVGATLTAVPGTWGPTPVALTYAWIVGGVAKATTVTYKMVAADVGKTIVVKVTGKKTGYTTLTKSSAATSVVVGILTAAPTPTISGTVKVGSTLTAASGTWGPAPVALSFAWSVGGVAKAATATYKIVAADAGKTILLKVTGKKTGYTTVTKTSAATVAVPAVIGTLAPAPTPTITGTVKVGSTLTATPGTWGPSPVALTYAWSVGGVVKATTATYKIAAADAGKTVVVKVTGTKTGYTTLTKTSAATVPVPATVGTLSPAPTPTITGTVKVGSTLTAVPGTWGPAPVTLAYAWTVGGEAKATTATYKIAAADVGKTIIVKVTGTKSGYTTLAKSSAATVAVPAVIGTLTPAPTPTITGTLAIGSTLTAIPGTWGPAPVSLAYSWTVGGVAKATTATYKIATADTGKTIAVTVTGTKAGYATLAKTSAATAAVPAADAPVHITSDITTDTTWALVNDREYIIDESVSVAEGKTLTVPAGLVVKVAPGAQVTVDGSLKVLGTVASPAVFTSIADDSVGGDTNGDGDDSAPTFGDWSGLQVSDGATFTATHLETRFSAGGISSSNAAELSVSDSAIAGGVSATRRAGSAYAARTITIVRNNITEGPVRVTSENVSGVAVPIQVSGNSVSHADGFAYEISDLQLRPSNLTGNTAAHNTINALGINGVLVEDWSMPTNTIPVVFLDYSMGNWWDVTIAVGKTLTVPAGLVLKLARDAHITVDGSLRVLGTAVSPVIFTSIADDSVGGDTNGNGDDNAPTFGDWSGLDVSEGATLTATHLDARFSSGGISSSNATELSLSDSVISGGVSATRSAGSAYAARKITILRNTITGGPVRVSSENLSSAAVPMQVSGNNVSQVDGFAFEISDLQLRPSNFVGNTAANNTTNALGMNGILVENWSMPTNAIPVVFLDYSTGNWWDVTIAAGKTLTIPAGIVLKFSSDAHLTVNGSLKVLGTAASPVVFTSIADDSAGGDTNGNGDDNAPEFGNWSGLDVSDAATFTATYLDARFSSSGVTASDAAELSVSDSAISGGVSATRSAGSAYAARKITILRSTITGGPVRVSSENVSSAAVPMQVSGNSVSGVDGYAFEISDLQLRPSKITGNTAANNTINALGINGILVENWNMPSNAIPVVFRDYTMGHWWGVTVASGKTLTVPAGLILKFSSAAHLLVDGSLKVLGTAAQPVVFTSLADDSVGGDTNGDGEDSASAPYDWAGVNVSPGATFSADYLEVRYAGTSISATSDDGGDDTTVSLDHTTLKAASTCLELSGSVGGHFRGTVRECEFGVVTDSYFDATAVDWGNNAGPGIGENPLARGELLNTFPWVGAVVPPPVTVAPVTVPVKVANVCPDYLFIGMMGSGERSQAGNSDLLGAKVRGIYAGFKQSWVGEDESWDSATIKAIGIDYEANAVPIVGTPDREWYNYISDVSNYVPGAWDGSVQLIAQMQASVDTCGDSGQRMVLAGYSQGAWAIHAALSYLELISSPLLDNVAGVALLANPLRSEAISFTNEGSADPGKGVASTYIGNTAVTYVDWISFSALTDLPDVPKVAMGDFNYPSTLHSVTVETCDTGDAVCDTGSFFKWPRYLDIPGAFGTGSEIHGAYDSQATMHLGHDLRQLALAN
jgi:hypothetical protein